LKLSGGKKLSEINIEVTKGTGMEYWKKVVILLCLGWSVLWIHRTVLSPILPELRAELNIGSDASAGLIASVFFLAYTMMQIPSGLLGDRFGKVAVLVPGLLLFGFASIGVGLASTFTLLLVARFMTGIGQATYYGPAYSLSSETIPKDRRSLATAIINSGTAIGMAIGLIGSTYWVKVNNWDWRILLFISGGLGIATAIVFKMVLKEKPKSEMKTGKEASADSKATIKALFGNPKMLTAFLMYFGTCYGYYMTVTWLPAFLEKERGFQGGAIGFASSLVAFSAIPGALLFSRFADKFMHRKFSFIVTLELLAALTLYLTVAVKSSSALMVCLILYGFIGKIAVEPILISYVADSAPAKGLSTTFGVFNFFGMMSSVVAPWATGAISDATGSKILGFYLAAIIIVIGVIAMLLGNMKKTKLA
jgi:MFS family permease